jgi:4-diphosphocytidyl-2-C-methyl-D-erythritol kinase
MTKIILKAPAKINLYLHITGKRPDGYHILDSLVTFCDISDHLIITASDHFSLTCDGEFAQKLPRDITKNIIYKAVMALAKDTNNLPHIAITLTKNLPIASGIGGGSSDAAAVLTGLAKIWNITDTNILYDIGQGLGADISACLFQNPCFMSDIGDVITPAKNIPSLPIVLINPLTPVSTEVVFQNRENVFSPSVFDQFSDLYCDDFIKELSKTSNDLKSPACDINSDIKAILAELKTEKDIIFSQMSGSGATCFAVFKTQEQAKKYAQNLCVKYPNWWIKSGKTYSSPPA